MKYYLAIMGISLLGLMGCQSGTSGTLPSTLKTTDHPSAATLVGIALSGEATAAMLPNSQTIELTLRNSATLNAEPDFFALHTSRAAWVFFQNTRGKGYDRIAVKCHVLDTVATQEYSVDQLNKVQARMPIVDQAVKLLAVPNYAGLAPLFDPALMTGDGLQQIQDICIRNEEKFGRAINFDLMGFAFFATSTGQQQLAIVGTLNRTVDATPLTMTFDMNKPAGQGSLSSMRFSY